MTVLRPPVPLALAQPARVVPEPQAGQRPWAYEPKFDGWRAALFTAVGWLQSRRDNNLAGRFPEIVAAASRLGDIVLDGEIVALRDGRLDFGALTSSPHTRADAGVSIYLIAFDLLARADLDLRDLPYQVRRAELERLFADVVPPLQLAPSTTDHATALTWMHSDASAVGIEGVVAKRVDAAYPTGRSDTWVKVRHVVVVDAVITGVTGVPTHPVEVVVSRLDDHGELRSVGLSLPLTPQLRREIGPHVQLTGEPAVRVSTGVFGRGHTEYLPVVPDLVVEIEVEAAVVEWTHRLRPRVHRLRPDLTADDLAT